MSLNREDNNTSLFLVPILGLKVEYLRHEHGFVNGYIADIDLPFEDNVLYLLFLPNDIKKLYHFINREQGRCKDFKSSYNYEDYVVITYNFPSHWLKEWDLFIEGRYSEFRRKFVELLPQEEYKEDKHGPFTEPSLQYHICNQTRLLKNYWERLLDVKLDSEKEYWSPPNMDKEILDIEKIKNESTTDKEHMGELSKG